MKPSVAALGMFGNRLCAALGSKVEALCIPRGSYLTPADIISGTLQVRVIFLSLVTSLSLPALVRTYFLPHYPSDAKVNPMPSITDLSAEQEVTRQLHEWNKSAFGGLFDYLRKRCVFPFERAPRSTHVSTRCSIEQK